MRPLPTLRWVSRDGKLIILTRGVCTFARSFIAILLALYLNKLGFSLVQIGAFLSAGVAGSAFFAFLVSLLSLSPFMRERLSERGTSLFKRTSNIWEKLASCRYLLALSLQLIGSVIHLSHGV